MASNKVDFIPYDQLDSRWTPDPTKNDVTQFYYNSLVQWSSGAAVARRDHLPSRQLLSSHCCHSGHVSVILRLHFLQNETQQSQKSCNTLVPFTSLFSPKFPVFWTVPSSSENKWRPLACMTWRQSASWSPKLIWRTAPSSQLCWTP